MAKKNENNGKTENRTNEEKKKIRIFKYIDKY